MAARLVAKSGITDKKEYALEPGKTYFIGRARQAEIIVKDQQASRRHCAIEATPDGTWTLADQDSSNGTYVNRQRTKTRTLRDGDVIQVGKTTFEFHAEDAAPAAETPAGNKPDEETLLVGPDGGIRPKDAPEDAPAAKPSPEAKPASARDEPEPAPEAKRHVHAKQEASEEDLEDLFAFLDRIEAGERPAAAEEPERPRSAPHDQPPPTPRPAPADGEADAQEDAGPLFELVDKAEPVAEAGRPEPDAEPEKKGGGLLGFLRRKKRSDT